MCAHANAHACMRVSYGCLMGVLWVPPPHTHTCKSPTTTLQQCDVIPSWTYQAPGSCSPPLMCWSPESATTRPQSPPWTPRNSPGNHAKHMYVQFRFAIERIGNRIGIESLQILSICALYLAILRRKTHVFKYNVRHLQYIPDYGFYLFISILFFPFFLVAFAFVLFFIEGQIVG